MSLLSAPDRSERLCGRALRTARDRQVFRGLGEFGTAVGVMAGNNWVPSRQDPPSSQRPALGFLSPRVVALDVGGNGAALLGE